MTKVEKSRIDELSDLFKTLNTNVGLLNINVEKVLKDYEAIRIRSTEDLLATAEILKEYKLEAKQLKERASKLIQTVDDLIITVNANNILMAAIPCIDAVKKQVKLDPTLPKEIIVKIEKIKTNGDVEERR